MNVCRDSSCLRMRPAVKNHTRSRISGPPTVYSYVGTVLSSFVSLNGVVVRQLSLLNELRNDPLKRLPPDLVIALTSPPPKRPYSAEIPAVATVVSCSASSMNSVNGCPRRFSVMATPLTMYRLSKDMAPEMLNEPSAPFVLFGPVALTLGASRMLATSVRLV